MGTGSGILAETALKFLSKNNILAVDINEKSVALVRKKGIKAVQSNLFSKIPKTKKYDLITFNAPYLPADPREPKDSQLATTGGKKGDELAVRFLKQALPRLNQDREIFLLISNLTPLNQIRKFHPKIVARKKLFFEELKILKIKKACKNKSSEKK